MEGNRINGRPRQVTRTVGKPEIDAQVKRATRDAVRREMKKRKPKIKKAVQKQAGERLQKSADAAMLQRLMAQRSRPQIETIRQMQDRFNVERDPLKKSQLGEELTLRRLRQLIQVRDR